MLVCFPLTHFLLRLLVLGALSAQAQSQAANEMTSLLGKDAYCNRGHTAAREKVNVVTVITTGGAKARTNVIGALHEGKLLTVALFESTINTLVFNA